MSNGNKSRRQNRIQNRKNVVNIIENPVQELASAKWKRSHFVHRLREISSFTVRLKIVSFVHQRLKESFPHNLKEMTLYNQIEIGNPKVTYVHKIQKYKKKFKTKKSQKIVI